MDNGDPQVRDLRAGPQVKKEKGNQSDVLHATGTKTNAADFFAVALA